MLDLTKTYRTRDGKHTGICLQRHGSMLVRSDATCNLTPRAWFGDGGFLVDHREHPFDLLPEELPFRYEDCPIIDGKRMAETMDGRKVVLLCNDAPGRPIRGYYADTGNMGGWEADGINCRIYPENNLRVPPKPKRTVWVNLYPAKTGAWHNSQAAADSEAVSTRIGNRAYPIEIEEDA